MGFDALHPLVVQANRSGFLAAFTKPVSRTEPRRTCRLTPRSPHGAVSAALVPEDTVAARGRRAKFPVPGNVIADVRDLAGRREGPRLEEHAGAA